MSFDRHNSAITVVLEIKNSNKSIMAMKPINAGFNKTKLLCEYKIFVDRE